MLRLVQLVQPIRLVHHGLVLAHLGVAIILFGLQLLREHIPHILLVLLLLVQLLLDFHLMDSVIILRNLVPVVLLARPYLLQRQWLFIK